MAPTVALTIEQQSTDLAELRRVLDRYHPGLHVYSDPEALDAAFARAAEGFAEGASPLAFVADLQLGIEAIGCTHTRLHPPEDAFRRAGATFFPLDLVVAEGRLWIDPRAHAGPPQALVSVEGVPAEALLDQLRSRISSDGRAVAYKDVEIDEDGPLLVTLALGERASWTVERAGADGVVVKEVLPGVTAREAPRGWSPARPALERIPVEGSQGIFYFHQTGFPSSDRRSRKLLEDFGTIARRSDVVILDLRGNGGGRTRSLLDEWALFAERPLTPYAEGWTRLEELGCAADPEQPGVFRAGPEDLYPPVLPRADAVAVPVVLLTDGTTVSSASDLAWFFQWEKRGLVVGGETASGRWLQNCEQYATFELPESGVVVRVPLESLATADVAGRGHGVVPDVEVAPTVDDLAAGRDPVFERGLELARSLIARPPE